jgi:L-ornithine N5-oxygenase
LAPGRAPRRRPHGRPDFHRDYRVVTPPEVTAGLYAPGATEHTHGLTSTLLSNVAVRAGEMAASMAALRDERVAADGAPPPVAAAV